MQSSDGAGYAGATDGCSCSQPAGRQCGRMDWSSRDRSRLKLRRTANPAAN